MKCPYCGNACKEGALICDACKKPLEHDKRKNGRREKKRKTPLQKVFIALCWAACFVALAIGIYKLVFTIDSYKIRRLYSEGGRFEPTVNAITLDDGRSAHALVFYGSNRSVPLYAGDTLAASTFGGVNFGSRDHFAVACFKVELDTGVGLADYKLTHYKYAS